MESGELALRTGDCVGSGSARRYEVGELLGRGGMGEVHRAFDERVGRDVAVKVLSAHDGSQAEQRARFLREARLQGVLDHPGIVPVHDVDRDESGRDFLVMKRVVGTTLEEVIRRTRDGDEGFPLRRTLSAYLQICLTVDYAHSCGVVHRDLKPSNMMLGDYGEAYLLDWGIAKVSDLGGLDPVLQQGVAALETVTSATALIGTPGYMAPEQTADPNHVDARADIYSLGVVLFKLLTLERLHRGSNVIEILDSTRRGADARPTVRAPFRSLPPEYDAICVRATEVDPAQRYATVRELHDAVARVLDGERDMRLRMELAAGHLAEAERALSSEGLPGMSPADASRRAMHHAARSLALYPESKAAAALVSRLMLTPPGEIPPEVDAEMSRLTIEEALRNARNGALVGIPLIVLTVSILAWLGVRSWSAVALMLGLLGGSVAIGLAAGPATKRFLWPSLVSALILAVAVATTARLGGSLWIPPICALMGASIVSWNHGLGRWRIACIALFLAGAMAPVLLEASGVTTSQYVFRGDGIFIRPDVVAFPPERIELAMAFGLAFAMILTIVSSLRFSHADVDTRRRLQLIAWHLRGLAPDAEEDPDPSAAVPSSQRLASEKRSFADAAPLEDTLSTRVELTQ